MSKGAKKQWNIRMDKFETLTRKCFAFFDVDSNYVFFVFDLKKNKNKNEMIFKFNSTIILLAIFNHWLEFSM